ncbi:MAG: hypothetical protein U0X20_27545 [Caldilineaceae bacterium]
MTKLAELESRRDLLAGDVADKQFRLDNLDGSEELVSVQKLTNDLDAAQRLLVAIERQIAAARETQRLAAIAAREAAIEAAGLETAKIDADISKHLWSVYELMQRRAAVTEVAPQLSARTARMQDRLFELMGGVGYDFAFGVGTGPMPVKR